MKYPRIFSLWFDAPLAIRPSTLDVIADVLLPRILEFERPDAAAPREFAPSSVNPYTTPEGVRVIPVNGVLDKRASWVQEWSGGTATESIAAEVKAAVTDPAIRALLLDIDSPGGTIDGISTIGDLVFEAREEKPVVAFTDGVMASAAYWIGSAATARMATRTAEVGSIGVIAVHVEYSKADEKAGVKRVLFRSGKLKGAANAYEPLSAEGAASIQQAIDEAFSLFIRDLSRNLGISEEQARALSAAGAIFFGEAARNAGLIESIGERADALKLAEEYSRQPLKGRVERSARGKENTMPLNETPGADATRTDAVAPSGAPPTASATPGDAEPTLGEALAKAGVVAPAAVDCDGDAIRATARVYGLDAKIADELIAAKFSLGDARAFLREKAAATQAPLQAPDSYQDAPPTADAVKAREKQWAIARAAAGIQDKEGNSQ